LFIQVKKLSNLDKRREQNVQFESMLLPIYEKAYDIIPENDPLKKIAKGVSTNTQLIFDWMKTTTDS